MFGAYYYHLCTKILENRKFSFMEIGAQDVGKYWLKEITDFGLCCKEIQRHRFHVI